MLDKYRYLALSHYEFIRMYKFPLLEETQFQEYLSNLFLFEN